MGTLDEVSLPVTRYQPFLNFRWPVMNTDHIRYFPTAIFTPTARTALSMAETQPADYVLTQVATRHGLDCSVDNFVGYL